MLGRRRHFSFGFSLPASRRVLLFAWVLTLFTSPLAHADTFDLAFFEEHLNFKANEKAQDLIKPVLEVFNRSRSHRAIAAVLNVDAENGSSYAFKMVPDAPTQLAASLGALQQCEQLRVQEQVAGHCELLVAGDTYIPTGAEMRSSASPQGPSMVWRIEGGENALYLGGSFHLMKPTLHPLPAAFDRAFEATQRLALESNLLLATDPNRQKINAALTAIDPAEFVGSQTKKQRRGLRKYANQQGMETKNFEAAQPVTGALSLALVGYYSLGFLPDAGLEMHFAQRAIEREKPIIELEAPGEVLGRLVRFPLEDQHAMLTDTVNQLQDNRYHASLFELFNAWLTGDEAQLIALADTSGPENSPGSRRITEYIINQRNQTMLTKVKGYLTEDTDTFVMVGALHLVGADGLLAGLTAAGYTPVRLANNGELYSAP